MASASSPSSFPPLEKLFGSSKAATGSWENVFQESVKPVVFYYIPMLIACYGVTITLLGKYTGWTGLKLQRLAGQFSMYPAFFVLIYTSHATMLDRRFWTADGSIRFLQSTESCDLFANFYIATNIVQALGQVQTEKAPLLYQLMAHHVLSIACYTGGFYFDRFRWWTAFAGCCEITNVFLVPVFASKDYFPAWREQRWMLWSSNLLWFTFVTHRLILFPAWLGLWVHDRWQVATSENSSEAHDIHWMEGILYPLTILGLFILSIVWFLQISKGLGKQKATYLKAQGEKQKRN